MSAPKSGKISMAKTKRTGTDNMSETSLSSSKKIRLAKKTPAKTLNGISSNNNRASTANFTSATLSDDQALTVNQASNANMTDKSAARIFPSNKASNTNQSAITNRRPAGIMSNSGASTTNQTSASNKASSVTMPDSQVSTTN